MIKKLTLSLLFTAQAAAKAFSQETNEKVEMADTLMQSGKIYVVVAVLVAVFLGIAVYLISIDRKLSRLEKEITKQ